LEVREEQNNSPWMLRIELDPIKMIDRKIMLSEIVQKIKEIYENKLNILYSDDNDTSSQVIRIRYVYDTAYIAPDTEGIQSFASFPAKEVIESLRELERNLLYEMPLKGIP